MKTIADFLLARATDDRVGVKSEVGTFSWREAVKAGCLRGALGQDLRKEGPFHIGVLLPNVPEFLFWLHAAALIGAVIVGINPTRKGESLAKDIRATDCQLIITDDDGIASLSGLDLGEALKVDDQSPSRIQSIQSPKYASLLSEIESATRHKDILKDSSNITRDDLYLLLFTSGTTGTPKAVKCSQGRLVDIALIAAPGYGYKSESVCYCPMPLFHGNALMALWAPAISVGASIALRPRFSSSEFLQDVRRYQATTFSYVGKAIAYILASKEQPDDADNTLVSAFGTEATERDRRRFAKRFDCILIEGYGQSEGGAALSPALGMPKKALGKPALGMDIAVINVESNKECPPARFNEGGELLNAQEAIGEIVNKKGTGKFEGYYRSIHHEERDASVAAEIAEIERVRNGWYWTGDLAYRDEDGWFYFAGRRGDWMRVDSENFSAGPIEAILSRHPNISVVCVYAVPDTQTLGDQVMAAIELSPEKEFSPDEFATWISQQSDLSAKWIPRYVRITSLLPETGTGKITKGPLRDESWHTNDPIWWRRLPQFGSDLVTNSAFERLSSDQKDQLDQALSAKG